MENQLPKRSDGMPDLNNWQAYVENCGYSTLDDLVAAREKEFSCKRVLLDKAIAAKQNEIAEKLLSVLCEEKLSVMAAISVLKVTIKKLKHRVTLVKIKELRSMLDT